MGHMKGHLTHMVIGAVAILAVLLVAGVDLGAALRYALVLACPLGMLGMMVMMNHKPGDQGADHQHHSSGGPSADVDTPRTVPDHERIGPALERP